MVIFIVEYYDIIKTIGTMGCETKLLNLDIFKIDTHYLHSKAKHVGLN